MSRRSRFLLLSQPRAGTHFVGGLLNTHPQITCVDEPMNPAVNRADIPARTIAEFIWQQSERPASGFMMHWNQHAEAGGLGAGFLDDLAQDVRVVWVTRRDALATIVSRRIAEITGLWQSSEPTTVRLTLSPADLSAAYEEMKRERDEIARWMRGRESALAVVYEDAVRAPDMPRVQAFLQVDFTPLDVSQCGVTRQERRLLSQVVQNYHELKRELAGTPLAWLFLPHHV